MLTNEMEKSTKFQNKWPMSWFIILWMVACNISLTCRAPQVWDLPHVGEMLHAIFTQNTTSYFPLPSHPIPSANYFSLKKSKWTQLPFFFREWWALGLLLERSALKANVIYWHCQLDLQLTRSVLIFNGSHRFLFVALSVSLFFMVSFLLLWEDPRFSLLNSKLLNSHLGKVVLFICNVLSVELSNQVCVSSDSVLLPLVNPRSQNLNKVATMTTIVFTSSTGNISVVGKSALKVHPGGQFTCFGTPRSLSSTYPYSQTSFDHHGADF